MTRPRLRAPLAAAASSIALLASGVAHANGAFPSSGQVLVDGAGGIGVRTTYGLVSSIDEGATWHWTCEAAIGYGGGPESFHPQLAVTEEGTVFGGLPDGIARGAIGACGWNRVPSLEGRAVVDVSRGPARARAIAAVAPSTPDGRAEVWWSDDDARTWTRASALLPAKFRPLTLDAAPSDPDRIYVSGTVDGSVVRGAVARSEDGGASWTLRFVPDADASKAPYLGAIDPLDEATVWVRLDAAPGQLLVSRDGGDTWETVLLLEGFLRAFALAPDGAEVIAGGEVDGLLRADVIDLGWRTLAPIAARCVQWRADAIDVCGTEALDGFTVGRSVDDGATFQPLFRQACLEGPLACAPGDPVAACADGWPALRESLGATGCGSGGATATTGAGGAPPATTGATAGVTAGPGSEGSASGGDGGRDGSGSARADASGGGCDCRSTRGPRSGKVSGSVAAVAALLAAMGRRRGRRDRSWRRGGAFE